MGCRVDRRRSPHAPLFVVNIDPQSNPAMSTMEVVATILAGKEISRHCRPTQDSIRSAPVINNRNLGSDRSQIKCQNVLLPYVYRLCM